jgi:hypothetical protein
LTTVVSRVCLDMLRGRKLRREREIGEQVIEPRVSRGEGADPEGEAVLADSVGVALLVVLVEAFLPAARVGDLEGLLDVLDPEAVLRIDAAARVDGVVRVDVPAAEVGLGWLWPDPAAPPDRLPAIGFVRA